MLSSRLRARSGRLAVLGRQLSLDAVEHAEATPTDEAVVDRVVRAQSGWRITPALRIPDYENNATHDPLAINPSSLAPMIQWILSLARSPKPLRAIPAADSLPARFVTGPPPRDR
jgi:hypothetical protein